MVNRVILPVVVLCISVLFAAMLRYYFMAVFLAAIFSSLAAPIHHRFYTGSMSDRAFMPP